MADFDRIHAQLDSDTDSDVITKPKSQTQHPKLYAVVMHNDNYTTMDFVVFVLMVVFEHSLDEAYELMMQIHHMGRAVVATLPFDIAEMKVDEVTALAEQEQFPLLTTIEPA